MSDTDRPPAAGARLALARRLVELQEAGVAPTRALAIPRAPRTAGLAQLSQNFIESHVSLDRHRELRAAVYAESLDEAELRDLVAFFETPAAQKFWRLQSAVVDRFMASVADEMAEHRGEIGAALRDHFRERALADGIPWTEEEDRVIEQALDDWKPTA